MHIVMPSVLALTLELLMFAIGLFLLCPQLFRSAAQRNGLAFAVGSFLVLFAGLALLGNGALQDWVLPLHGVAGR